MAKRFEETYEQGAVLRIRDMRKAMRRAVGRADIPLEIAQRARMHEPLQRGVKAAAHATEGFERGFVSIRLGKRLAGDPTDEAHAV